LFTRLSLAQYNSAGRTHVSRHTSPWDQLHLLIVRVYALVETPQLPVDGGVALIVCFVVQVREVIVDWEKALFPGERIWWVLVGRRRRLLLLLVILGSKVKVVVVVQLGKGTADIRRMVWG